jgi:hypothetical protein
MHRFGNKKLDDFINFSMKKLSLLAAANNGVNTPWQQPCNGLKCHLQ